MDTNTSNTAYAVIIEWNGNSAPGWFYNHLGKIVGARARSKRKGHSGVIVQESVVIVPSLSLAQAVVLAVEDAAHQEHFEGVVVRLATTNFLDLQPDDELMTRFVQLDEQLSDAGRPPAEKRTWVITCWECGKAGVRSVRRDHFPAQCPKCGSLRTRPRVLDPLDADPNDPHTPKPVPVPTGTLWLRWYQGRFARGHFEPLDWFDDPQAAVYLPQISDAGEKAAMEAMARSQALLDQLAPVARESETAAWAILDGVLLALAHIPPDARREARLALISKFYQENPECGGAEGGINLPLFPLRGEPDVLDCAAIPGARAALQPWIPVIFAPPENGIPFVMAGNPVEVQHI